MELVYILFVLGFVVLILGANWLVDGSVSLGLRTNLSPMVIGLTVVAFGTSLPELVINVFAALRDSSELALGNVLGSNIMNISLILGIAALLMPLVAEKVSVRRDIPVGILATVMLLLMANDSIFGFVGDKISQIDGLILLVAFVLYLYITFKKGKTLNIDLTIVQKKPYSVPKTILLIVVGCIGLYFGGDWVSDGALHVAAALGISESAIGLTIVAAATSLPELVTAIVAAIKKNIGIVLGNVLGSNILNIFLVLGVTAVIHPLEFNLCLNLEVLLVLLANIVLLGVIFIGKGLKITKFKGVLLIVFYCIFIYFSLTNPCFK